MRTITAFLFSLISATVFATSFNINGVWTNSYGSIMRLTEQQGSLAGCYSSTTGSTGAYPIIGFIDTKPIDLKKTTLAFAIPWRSYLGGSGDTSWHWASTMSGIYSIDKGEEKLQLINALDATTAFSKINTDTGIYPDSLIFTRYRDQNWQCPNAKTAQLQENDLIFGIWKSGNSQLVLKKSSILGVIKGDLLIDAQNYSVIGYYDYDLQNPSPTAKTMSVALIASNLTLDKKNQHSQLALIGELKPEQKILDLFTFKTFSQKEYSANKLGHLLFIKTIPIKVT